jgi:tetratricopeptide (TPR) repeat protein
MRSRKGVGKGRVSQWWVILAVVVMFLGSPAGTLKAVTVSFIAERDQTRLAAERAFAEAERLADQKNVDAIRQAIAKYAEAARLYHTLGERGKEAECLAGVGILSYQLGDRRKALEYFTQALALFRAVGNRAGEAPTLNNIGLVYSQLGEKQKALEYYTQALTLYRAVGNRDWEATTLHNIGVVYDALGEKQKALEYYTQAQAIIQAVRRSGK